MAYETYDAFEKFRRPGKMSFKEYISEFEHWLSKTMKYGSSMSSDILPYRLLKSVSLEDTQEWLISATVKELTYDAIHLQLKKIFGDNDSGLAKASGINVKMESDTFYAEADDTVEDVYYQRNWPSNRRYKNNNSNNRGRSNRSRRGGRSYGRGVSKRHKNPTDSHGNTGETLSAAVLDSGATSTVCRKTWINCYEETLSDEDRLKVRNEPNSTNFKFGDGWKVASIEKVTIPATIGEQSVRIWTSPVREEILLLLSKKSTKKVETNIDFKIDTVSMFGS